MGESFYVSVSVGANGYLAYLLNSERERVKVEDGGGEVGLIYLA